MSPSLVTMAVVVGPSTFVAELATASAGHVIASLVFLYPHFTLRALLVLHSFHELLELLVIFAVGVCDLVFFAGNAFVEFHLTCQAETLAA